MPEDFVAPVAFQFSVSFTGGSAAVSDAAFQEVSGLESAIDIETVVEGGENRFVHQLPKGVKHANLQLKRGVMDADGGLGAWVQDVLEGDFSSRVQPMGIVVHLLDAEQDPVASWSVENAYPVKWSLAGLDAKKSEIAVETIELAYTTCRRTL